jgi:hypothetical protein
MFLQLGSRHICRLSKPTAAKIPPLSNVNRYLATAAAEGGSLDWLGMAFFSGIVGTTLYLGTWQTKRYYWKQDMIAEREHSLALEAVSMPPGE